MKNIYKLKHIKYEANAFVKCAIGKEIGRNYITIEADMSDEIPDYDDIDKFILNEIEGQTLILEEVGSKLYNFCKDLFHPINLSVTCHSENNDLSTVWVTISE